MKFVTLIIAAFLWQNHCVYCDDFFGPIFSRVGEYTKTIRSTFDGIFNRMMNVFNPQDHNPRKRTDTDMDYVENQLKQSFQDFVESASADNDHDDCSREYASMKTEPTVLMSTPQLAALVGKQIDTHVVKTRDGYLLTLHRILSFNETDEKSQVVLLHHGLLGSSADWIMLGAISLPYQLSAAGFDVWMTNARGNYYSRAHVRYPVKSKHFWNFSWQEMGEYDLPAVIDYIRKTRTYGAHINFIGHSMGATALLVLLSTNPRYNEHIRIGILLAPLAFMNNVQGPLKLLTSMSERPPTQLLKTIGDSEFMPSRKIPKAISKKFCWGPKIFCHNPLLFFAGSLLDDDKHNASFIARLLYHVPAGGSTNTILHFGQLVQNGNFHKYKRRNSEFPLSLISAPLVLLSSDADFLANSTDVLRLYFSLSNPIDNFIIRDKNLSHTEFVWGADAHKWVFPKILEYIKNGLVQEITKDNEV